MSRFWQKICGEASSQRIAVWRRRALAPREAAPEGSDEARQNPPVAGGFSGLGGILGACAGLFRRDARSEGIAAEAWAANHSGERVAGKSRRPGVA